MRFKAGSRALVVALLGALVWTGAAPAVAEEQRGIDPNQGRNLVEVTLDSRAAAMRLQLQADRYGIEFNEHYLRRNRNGTVTATVFGYEDELDALAMAGYDLGAVIEGPATWREHVREYLQDRRQVARASAAARRKTARAASHQDEIVILRVDYFENYAGRFLSVEAKTRQGGAAPTGATYTGPALTLSYNRGGSTTIDSPPRIMSTNIDPDTTPDTYIEHRELVRIGEVGTTDPPRPSRIRVGSSTGASKEAPVNTWLGGGLPPMHENFIRDFTTGYMDPTEIYAKFEALEDEFPNLAELITLPNRTNGYQRRAQATMAGNAIQPGNTPQVQNNADQTRVLQEGAVVLTSRAWGHDGGNDITAEFRNPGAPNSTLSVQRTGNDIVVLLGTDATGTPNSTARQVVDAINASPANQILVASVFTRMTTDPPGVPGTGVVLPRAQVDLSDFLTTATNAHVRRGPFEYSVLRISKKSKHKGKWKSKRKWRDRGKRSSRKVGVFLYCQQHAREWATPLTCLETASQLLTNYALDRRTRRLVDNLDIFILPVSNPDGSHYSRHNFNLQRRNLTNHCVVGGKKTDNPFAPDFWTVRTNPETGQPYVHLDPGARNSWGVDLNRNNTFGTIFDGYIGASHSCSSDVYAGPAEASEPEIRNELWIADTFDNIKFSNNIHSFGGYFMWAPGTYLPDRSEGAAVHANIGIEKYFFEAGERILNRIKEHRNTVILPERTGPIADVLYSAAGNSADEHWYNRGVIAYSFETGADLYFVNMQDASPAGARGIRINPNTVGLQYLKPGDTLRIGVGGPNQVTRTVESVDLRGAQQNPRPNANIFFTESLPAAYAANTRVEGAALQTGVGFQPDYATEGKHEALEFAAGNYGLLESAFEYARDDEDPRVRMTGQRFSTGPIEVTFEWINEPSVIRYTTDGSRPTESSRLWNATGPREPGETFHLTRTTTFRWMATDIKGNVSFGRQTFVIRNRDR